MGGRQGGRAHGRGVQVLEDHRSYTGVLSYTILRASDRFHCTENWVEIGLCLEEEEEEEDDTARNDVAPSRNLPRSPSLTLAHSLRKHAA
jgi:hypothetical protein